MITGDPFLLVCAMLALFLGVLSYLDDDNWQWCYFAVFILALFSAYNLPTTGV